MVFCRLRARLSRTPSPRTAVSNLDEAFDRPEKPAPASRASLGARTGARRDRALGLRHERREQHRAELGKRSDAHPHLADHQLAVRSLELGTDTGLGERPQRAGQSHAGARLLNRLERRPCSRSRLRGPATRLAPGSYSRPDPRCTPGALNPAVDPGQRSARPSAEAEWTATVRPPESDHLPGEAGKHGRVRPLRGATSPSYEYDHFVTWSSAARSTMRATSGPSRAHRRTPRTRSRTSSTREVCDGQMTLAQAQRAITTNWVALAARASAPAAERPDFHPRAPRSSATVARRCAVHGHRLLQRPLPRLRRLRPLQPARSDGDGHRRLRPLVYLAHRRLRLRRRLLQVRRLRARAADHCARRAGHLLDEPLNAYPWSVDARSPPVPETAGRFRR